MGIRSRTSRENRRRQRERARARRRAMMANARPRCPSCESILAQEESLADVWRCADCGVSFLRMGAEWLVQVEALPAAADAALPKAA